MCIRDSRHGAPQFVVVVDLPALLVHPHRDDVHVSPCDVFVPVSYTHLSGHGTSGRLDICVNREDGTPYMLIECKTYGKEYNKELAKIRKDGGPVSYTHLLVLHFEPVEQLVGIP